MLKEISVASYVMLSEEIYDPSSKTTAIAPFITGRFERNQGGYNEWTVDIICFMRVAPEDIDNIKIYISEFHELAGDMLPMKEICIFRDKAQLSENLYGWYFKTNSFDLDDIYSVLEISIDDDVFQGKIRGGRTVGISTRLNGEKL